MKKKKIWFTWPGSTTEGSYGFNVYDNFKITLRQDYLTDFIGYQYDFCQKVDNGECPDLLVINNQLPWCSHKIPWENRPEFPNSDTRLDSRLLANYGGFRSVAYLYQKYGHNIPIVFYTEFDEEKISLLYGDYLFKFSDKTGNRYELPEQISYVNLDLNDASKNLDKVVNEVCRLLKLK